MAGPPNGDVVASCRNTSRKVFSCGLRTRISRSRFLCLLVCIRLPDFLRRPVACVLRSGSSRRMCSPSAYLPRRRPEMRPTPPPDPRIVSPGGNSRRRQPDLSLLESDRLPTERAVHCRQSPIKHRSFGLVPLDVPVFYLPMTVRAFYVGGHRWVAFHSLAMDAFYTIGCSMPLSASSPRRRPHPCPRALLLRRPHSRGSVRFTPIPQSVHRRPAGASAGR